MFRSKQIKVLFVLPVIILGACSIAAPKYSPSYENVQLLSGVKNKVEVIAFKGESSESGIVQAGGNPLSSPYGKDFVHYIQKALELELDKAGLLTEMSSKKLSAIVNENEIDVQPFSSTGNGVIKVTFSIIEDEKKIYENLIVLKKQWKSSSPVTTAIASTGAYHAMVQSLLKKLYSDKKFIAALMQ